MLENKFKSKDDNIHNLKTKESINDKEDTIFSNKYNLQEKFQDESSIKNVGNRNLNVSPQIIVLISTKIYMPKTKQ